MARPLNVRVTDVEHDGLLRLVGGRGVSTAVRQAIQNHLLFRSGEAVSAFFTVFATLLEQLVSAGVHPVVVGRWAAVAHGYVHAVPRLQLVVRHNEEDALRAFISARGAAAPALPFEAGREPWCVEFLLRCGGVVAEDLPVERIDCGRVAVDVLTLDGLLHRSSDLDDYVVDDLHLLKAGDCDLDDGERGMVAWDLAGRLTASGAYPDPLSREPHRFVDLRVLGPRGENT